MTKLNLLKMMYANLKHFQSSLTLLTYLLTHLLPPSGRMKMLKRVFSANFSEESVRNLLEVKAACVVKLTSCFVVIHLLLSRSCFNTSTRLHPVVSTHPEREVQLWVSQSISQKILTQRNLYLKVVLWSFLIVVSAALMSLIRWPTTPASSSTKPWSSKLYP